MIRVATAECFTHGLIARELHLRRKKYGIAVICGLFLPTLESLKILDIEDYPKPIAVVDGIKVYDEKGDREIARKMAEAVKKKFDVDIAIGSSAGIGRGCIVIITEQGSFYTTSDVYANFLTSKQDEILKRQESGIRKALELFEKVWRDFVCSNLL
jgi:uncharacterized protein (UPF0254 family)